MPAIDALPWKDYITLGAALLGACLGVMNTWNSINQRRVRLRVRPAHAIMVPRGPDMFSIEVVNLSAFSVTVFEVGFTIDGKSVDNGRRMAVPTPLIHDGKPWPRRLEPREAVSAYFDPGDILPNASRIGKAYARTSCGEVAYGSSPALDQLRRS